MPEKLTYPIILNIIIAIAGALFGLVLGGHIKENGDLNLKSKWLWIVIIGSVLLSILGGDFVIEHYGLINKSEQYKRFIYFMISVFGFLILGTAYRAYQLTCTDKTLSEIINEIRNIIKTFIK